MPWSNQTGGNGSNDKGGGPWGSGSNGKGPKGPKKNRDIEELIQKSQNRLRQILPSGGGQGPKGVNPIVVGFAALAMLGFIFYNFFTFRVEPEEQGVVLRFGELHRTTGSGLHFRLPYPVERVSTPPVTRVQNIEVGTRTSASRASVIRDVPEESLMLTGDENIVDIDFEVFWVIKNAGDYLFNVKDPEGTVKVVAESAMREVVGNSDIQPLLTQARQITAAAAQELMQTTLDSYGAGIEITGVNLLAVNPPDAVIDAFRDVQAARADAERLQNEAQTYANEILPKARGEAAQILESARGYREQTVAQAEGQADRFLKIYQEYALAPEVTRRRLYLETMERVLGGMDKIIIGEEGAQGTGVVPYLPLNELRGNTSRNSAN